MNRLRRILRSFRLSARLLACLLLGDVCTACSSLPTEKQLADAKAKIDEAKDKAEAVAKKFELAKAKAVKTSRDALAFLTNSRALLVALGTLPPDVAAKSGDVLTRASAVLDRIERGEAVAKEEIATLLDEVAATAGDLRKYGGKVDPIVDSALDLARVVVGDVP
jgi:hypothetical protein